MVTHRSRIPVSYRVVATLLRSLMRLTTRRQWRGIENIPADGGFIVTPNHISYADTFAWGHLFYNHGIPPVFLVKSDLYKFPLLRQFLINTGQIRVERGTDRASQSLIGATRALAEHRCVAMYPEGTLTRDPQLWPMRGKTGAARLALATGAPVIPIATWGPQMVWPPYTKRLHLLSRHLLQTQIGPPVDLADLRSAWVAGDHSAALIESATQRIMDAIVAALCELREGTPPKRRFDPAEQGMPSTGWISPEHAYPSNRASTTTAAGSADRVSPCE